MKPLRILLVSTYAEPVGGAETYLFASMKELGARGHTTALFGTSPEREVDEADLRVVERPEWAPERLFVDPSVRSAFREFAGRFRPDVVHVHNLHALGLDLIEAMAECGVPVVQTVHDFSVLCPNSWCVRGDGSSCPGGAGAWCFEHDCGANYPFDARQVLHTRLRLELTRNLVDVAVSPSTTLAERLRENGFEDVRHVHYFVDTGAFTPPTEPRRPGELLFLGRLVPEKGLDVLIEAMGEVVRQEPKACLTILGDGQERAKLEARAAELSLGAAVRFLAKVPHDEVDRFLRSAGALVVPSTWSENSPVSIHESLAVGLPIVASDIGGIPDLVQPGKTGWLARPRDAKDLSAKLVEAIRSPDDERARLAAEGRAFAESLTRERNLDALEEIYAELIARAPSTRSETGVRVNWSEDLAVPLARALAAGPSPTPPLSRRVRQKLRRLLGRA